MLLLLSPIVLFPKLADDSLKRTCLYCFVEMNMFAEDTEQYSFFVCYCKISPRELFIKACPRFYSVFFPESPPESAVVSMAKIFLKLDPIDT